MTELTLAEWDACLAGHPQAHLLQSGAWGELKAGFGWRVRRVTAGDAGAQVLFRPMGLGFSLAYLPKGPVGGDWAALWKAVDPVCRAERAVLLKVEPDLWEGQEQGLPPDWLRGFVPSPQAIQPRRTVTVSLEGSEEALLGRMKQKTRYNIRLAEKKGVTVRPCADLGAFQRLMEVTAGRDGFGVHTQAYYQKAYDLFARRGECALLLAEYASQPLAGLMVFRWGERAWYLYGASSDLERSRMPAYLLQWEAMRWARGQGCREYDLWGIPDAEEAELEAQFAERSDGLWGVYRFKRGFGGEVRRSAGAWDRVYVRPAYPLYRWLVRRRGAGQG